MQQCNINPEVDIMDSKTTYEELNFEVICFESADVIVTSEGDYEGIQL